MENKFYRLGHRLVLGSLVSLFLCSTLLFFGPLNLYLKNKDDFWFSFESILWPVIIIFLIAFAICTVICTLAPKQIIHKIFCSLVFGIALAIFIQGNFANIKYGSGVLDGSEIVWEDYTTYGAIDCGIWAACITLPFALVMMFKNRWRAILITASIAFVLVQALGLTTGLVSNKDELNKSTCEIQSEGMYELSDNNNTLVFVLDDFDQAYYKEYLDNHPETKELLNGFIEYDNALAGGGKRIEAFSSLITGTAYKRNTSFINYIDETWANDNVYRMIKGQNVDTRIYADSDYFSSDASEYITNVVRADTEKGANTAIIKTIYKYTLFEYSQHYLKPRFWLDATVFNTFKSENSYERDDAVFYENYLNNDGFTYSDKYSNAIRIYSLDGACTPYSLTSDGERSGETTSLEEQIEGCFTYITSMINDLKSNKLYDKSNIFIVGNCGDKDIGQNPALLVKRANQTIPYKVSSAPVSLIDFPTSLASLYSLDYKDYGDGTTFFNVKENQDVPRARYYYYNTGANQDARIQEYKTTHKANELDKMDLTKMFYANNGVQEKYTLGDRLSFKMDATANMYCTEGFMGTTGWRTPLAGPVSEMIIPIKSIPNSVDDLHVYFEVNDVNIDSNFTIYANNMKVYSRKASDSMVSHGINFTVPTGVIDKKRELKLDFKFDDISQDEMQENVTLRTNTLSFESFKIYTQ